jgi:hypothetical protein
VRIGLSARRPILACSLDSEPHNIVRRARTLAKKRRKVLSETYRNLAIADFGRRAASMSAKSSHSCDVGCQLFRIGVHSFYFGPR